MKPLTRSSARRALPPAMALLALFGATVAGCTPEDAPPRTGWDGVVDTLAGGRTVVRNGGTPLWADDGGWRLREEVRIGSVEGEGPTVFGEIRAVEADGAGRIYVLESQAGEVRVFGADGAFLRAFGRPGEGPGELSGPAGLAWAPDGTLWVMDFRNARYTSFDPESGALLEERRRPFSYFALPWSGGFDGAGLLHDVGLARMEGTPGIASLVRLDSAFAPSDTLALPSTDDEHTILFPRPDGTLVMSMLEPFSPRPVWALWSAGGIIASDGAEYRIHYVGFGPDTVRTVELERPRPLVTAAERDSVLTVFRERGRDLAGDARPSREPRVPDAKPAIASLLESDRGHLWVRPYVVTGAPERWDVFDPEGRYLGSVEVPEAPGAARPVVRGDRLVVPIVDELGVPIVLGYRIEGR